MKKFVKKRESEKIYNLRALINGNIVGIFYNLLLKV